MTDLKNSNQVVRKLKLLNVEEPDLSIINIQELRSRNVNEELHTLPIRQLPPGLICVQSTVQLLDKKILAYHTISQSIPALVSTISPKSNSDLDTDQDEIIDDTLRKVVQMFNQTILMATVVPLPVT